MREHKLRNTLTFHHLHHHPHPASSESREIYSEAEADCSTCLTPSRPFKVCGPCKVRKGIVAATFQELLEKARQKFPDAGEDVTLVLLEDKTEIDEEYFQSLEDNTVFLIVPVASYNRGRPKTRNCDK